MFQDIPSSGQQKWYKLEGRSARSSVEGEIKLRLALATREDRGIPEDDNWTDVKQHEDLMCLFIEHEVRRCKVTGKNFQTFKNCTKIRKLFYRSKTKLCFEIRFSQ